ncbi:MAG: alpha/beta fold hydrolase, partial [Anaerolineales bacterium]|nr:alpha/beta fold hydrolase [Anaerolineales bacterium]
RALPVMRVRATSDNPAEPIFRLTGGLGQSNMVGFSLVPWFIEDHDIVLVGYRGVDGPVVLACPEVVKAIKTDSGDWLGDSALESINVAYASCAARLQAEGIDTDGYTVAEGVDDLETARTGLGYERINLLSGSYGTNVARIYAYMYPESIFRSAMVAVDAPGATVQEPQVVDEQLEYYADLCAQDTGCSARTDDLVEALKKVSQDMPKRWLFFPINDGLMKAATIKFLGTTEQAPQAFDVWLAAAKGDPSGMALMTFLGPRQFASASIWGDNASKRLSLGEFDPARDYRDELNPPDSILGSPETIISAESLGWPANPIAEEFRGVQPSDVETLIVSGNIDFNTPVKFARDDLLPSLSNGQMVILSEYGHGEFLNQQPEASKHLLTSFYDTGVGDDSLYTYQPADFSVGTLIRFPNLAKLILVIPVLVILLIVFLAWYFFRRRRLRETSYISG